MEKIQIWRLAKVADTYWILRMKNIYEGLEKIKINVGSINFFFENRAFCERMLKNMVQADR
jgi:hypothetical protein